jgi:hypothetical protein
MPDFPPLDLAWVHVMLFAFVLTIVPPNVLIMKAFTFIKMAFTFIKKVWLAMTQSTRILIVLAVLALCFIVAAFVWLAHFKEASFTTYQDAFPSDMGACALKQYHLGSDSPDPSLRSFWKTRGAPTCHIPDMMPLDRVPKWSANVVDYFTGGPKDPVVSFETFHAFRRDEKLHEMQELAMPLAFLAVVVKFIVVVANFYFDLVEDGRAHKATYAAAKAAEDEIAAAAEAKAERRAKLAPTFEKVCHGLVMLSRFSKKKMCDFIIHEAINVEFEGFTAFALLSVFAKSPGMPHCISNIMTWMRETPLREVEEEWRREMICMILSRGMKCNQEWVPNLLKDVAIIWAAKSRAASSVTTLAIHHKNITTLAIRTTRTHPGWLRSTDLD